MQVYNTFRFENTLVSPTKCNYSTFLKYFPTVFQVTYKTLTIKGEMYFSEIFLCFR